MNNITEIILSEAQSLSTIDVVIKLKKLANSDEIPTFENTILELEKIKWVGAYPENYFNLAKDIFENKDLSVVSFWNDAKTEVFSQLSSNKQNVNQHYLDAKIYERIIKVIEKEEISSTDSKRLLNHYFKIYNEKN